MSKKIREIIHHFGNALQFHKVIFFLCLMISIIMLTAGFLLPPKGEIDNSVLLAVGELFAFAALASGVAAVENGKEVQVRHNNTEVTFGDINRHDNDYNDIAGDYGDIYNGNGDDQSHRQNI